MNFLNKILLSSVILKHWHMILIETHDVCFRYINILFTCLFLLHVSMELINKYHNALIKINNVRLTRKEKIEFDNLVSICYITSLFTIISVNELMYYLDNSVNFTLVESLKRYIQFRDNYFQY